MTHRGYTCGSTFFNPSARWGWVVNVTSRPLYLRERDPVPTVLVTGGGGAAPVSTGSEYLAPIGIVYTEQPFRKIIINICIGVRHDSCISEQQETLQGFRLLNYTRCFAQTGSM
jgi:hypothetical protein